MASTWLLDLTSHEPQLRIIFAGLGQGVHRLHQLVCVYIRVCTIAFCWAESHTCSFVCDHVALCRLAHIVYMHTITIAKGDPALTEAMEIFLEFSVLGSPPRVACVQFP